MPMAYHRCTRHGLMSNIPCENTLITGTCCPKPVCSACVDCYDELCIKHNVSRKMNTHSYCGDCIVSFFQGKHHLVTPNDKPLVIPLSDLMISLKAIPKSVIDLTISSSNSNDSLDDIDQNIVSCDITKSILKHSVVRIEKYIDTSTSLTTPMISINVPYKSHLPLKGKNNVDDDSNSDTSGDISNHTVASKHTKPMMQNTVPRKPNLPLKVTPNVNNYSKSNNTDSVSGSNSFNKQQRNKNSIVVTEPTSEKDMSVCKVV